MTNLFPKKKRDFFERLPSFFQRDVSLFDGEMDFQSPKVDVKESRWQYTIEVELPGFYKDNVAVDFKDGYITIKAKREESLETKDDDRFVRKERSYGSVQRSFYVGDIDEEKIEGKFENGLLTLKVPKSDEDFEETSGYRIDLQ
ncbi:Hsp20/alpha crystallin family protein [Texcoconibacillus texcoconensis]|uniref:HSP20 family protein n=1 Tax=Texcoconibacillus texcoconensis TaxID=1095777 RepID=A0A840QV05_9BACI|nr:Hsp20/alpha crystallin family protein [Texcoconibacillus texcoconensis]MBB5175133.1 HSP20 family protein [Texcoconibacillus texcoconensis]